MNWNEHILSTKAKAEKNQHHQMLSPHQMGGGATKEIFSQHKMIILSTLRYGEEVYGSASKPVLKSSNQPITEQ
jgi:hypothetical protein